MPTAGVLAAALAVVGLLLASPVSAVLARASWPWRAPRAALVLWQAVCLSAGLSVVGAGVVLAVQPLGHNVFSGVLRWFTNLITGHPLAGQSKVEIAVGATSSAVAAVLFGVLLRSLLVAVRRRRAHRVVLDLLTGGPAGSPRNRRPAGPGVRSTVRLDSADLLAGVRILDHPTAVAYTVPGWHSRVVLSVGLLDLLDRDELAAVIGHERAHIRFHHDLLVLPFQAWATALGALPGVRRAAGAVAELAEMLADDMAVVGCSRKVLARALARVALAGAPTADPGPDPAHLYPPPVTAGGVNAVGSRVNRLLDPRPLARWQTGLVYLLAGLLVVLPTLVLLRGWR